MTDTGWRRMIGRTALLLLTLLHFATGGVCAATPVIYALQTGETLIFFLDANTYEDGKEIELTVEGTEKFKGSVYSAAEAGWKAGTVKKVIMREKIAPDDASGWFAGMTNLTEIQNMGKLYIKMTIDVTGLFKGCAALQVLNLSEKTASEVKYADELFSGCSGLTELKLMKMPNATLLEASSMFSGCSRLTSLDVSSINTSKCNTFEQMFYGCSSLTNLNVSGIDTSSVKNMEKMFSGCSSLTSLDVSGFDTSSVTNMEDMFSGCSGLTSLDVSGFDTSAATNLKRMFAGCSGLRTLKLGNALQQRSPSADMTDILENTQGITTFSLGEKSCFDPGEGYTGAWWAKTAENGSLDMSTLMSGEELFKTTGHAGTWKRIAQVVVLQDSDGRELAQIPLAEQGESIVFSKSVLNRPFYELRGVYRGETRITENAYVLESGDTEPVITLKADEAFKTYTLQLGGSCLLDGGAPEEPLELTLTVGQNTTTSQTDEKGEFSFATGLSGELLKDHATLQEGVYSGTLEVTVSQSAGSISRVDYDLTVRTVTLTYTAKMQTGEDGTLQEVFSLSVEPGKEDLVFRNVRQPIPEIDTVLQGSCFLDDEAHEEQTICLCLTLDGFDPITAKTDGQGNFELPLVLGGEELLPLLNQDNRVVLQGTISQLEGDRKDVIYDLQEREVTVEMDLTGSGETPSANADTPAVTVSSEELVFRNEKKEALFISSEGAGETLTYLVSGEETLEDIWMCFMDKAGKPTTPFTMGGGIGIEEGHTVSVGYFPRGTTLRIAAGDLDRFEARVNGEKVESVSWTICQGDNAVHFVRTAIEAAEGQGTGGNDNPEGYRYRFAVDVVWNGGQSGMTTYQLYDVRGQKVASAGARNGGLVRWFQEPVTGTYAIQDPIPSVYTTYDNSQALTRNPAEKAAKDRAYNGGRIVNVPIPGTGDRENLWLWGAGLAAALVCLTAVLTRKKR